MPNVQRVELLGEIWQDTGYIFQNISIKNIVYYPFTVDARIGFQQSADTNSINVHKEITSLHICMYV